MVKHLDAQFPVLKFVMDIRLWMIVMLFEERSRIFRGGGWGWGINFLSHTRESESSGVQVSFEGPGTLKVLILKCMHSPSNIRETLSHL